MNSETTEAKPVDANLPAQLMAKPALTWEEFWNGILGLPSSTAELVAKQDPPPRFFLIGRRRYILTPDAIAWLNEAASAAPYFPRRNKKAAA
jgi:hypothetical protein